MALNNHKWDFIIIYNLGYRSYIIPFISVKDHTSSCGTGDPITIIRCTLYIDIQTPISLKNLEELQ